MVLITITKMNRRWFITGFLGAVFLRRLGAAWSGGADSLETEHLHALFKRPAAVMRIGLAYLATVPRERDEVQLRKQVFAGWSVAERDSASRDREVLRRYLVAQSRNDFRYGRVVQVDGWLLSKTEACLCALLAVSSAGDVSVLSADVTA